MPRVNYELLKILLLEFEQQMEKEFGPSEKPSAEQIEILQICLRIPFGFEDLLGVYHG